MANCCSRTMMSTIQGFTLLLMAAAVTGYPCSPADLESCPKPPGSLSSVQQVPQLITITWDDGVTPVAYDIVQQITGGFQQRNGCPVPSTFYATVINTIPAAVQALYLKGSEIATHTITHVGYPSADEIVGCRKWLVNATGIPESKIVGFRAPFLLSNAATRQALATGGFLYDSSIPDTTPSPVSPDVTQRLWPFRMDNGIPQTCSVGECDSSEKYPLWEVPLWAVEDANKASIASMDPEGNAYDNYKRELDWRMAGNRAPLGLFFHAGLESEVTRIAQLRQFIEYALSLEDVWFVTTSQMLAWMSDPMPASKMAATLTCATPNDISPLVGPACDTYVGNCVFGSFDATKCACACLGEGSPGGYCKDAIGACTVTC